MIYSHLMNTSTIWINDSMNNRILTNINEDNLEEIILEEILPLDDTQLEKYVNELVAEMFSTEV